MSDCTEPNRAACPRLCQDFCNAAEDQQAESGAPSRSKEWLAAVALIADALRVALEAEKRKLQSHYDNPVKDEHLRHYQPYRTYLEALQAWKAANVRLTDGEDQR